MSPPVLRCGASEVAVDDADDDDDGHARDDRRGEDQPAVLERPRDHVAQEDRSRVDRVVRVARARPRRRGAGHLPGGRRRRLSTATRRRDGRPLDGTNTAVTGTRRSTREIQPAHNIPGGKADVSTT